MNSQLFLASFSLIILQFFVHAFKQQVTVTDSRIHLSQNLYSACRDGNHRMVQTMLANRVVDASIVNFVHPIDRTSPLEIAIKQGHVACVISLLSSHKTIVDDSSDWGILHFAAAAGKHARTSALIFRILVSGTVARRRFNVNQATLDEGYTFLYLAISQAKSLEMVQTVIDLAGQDLDPNIQTLEEGRTALMEAIALEDLNILNLLLALPNLNIGLQDNSGWNAFHYAASVGNPAIVSLLISSLEAGERSYNKSEIINAKDEESGWSAIHYACSQPNFVELLSAFLPISAHVEWGQTSDIEIETPLIMLCKYADQDAQVETMLKSMLAVIPKSALNLAHKDPEGHTALDYALSRSFDRVALLLGHSPTPTSVSPPVPSRRSVYRSAAIAVLLLQRRVASGRIRKMNRKGGRGKD